MKYYLRGCLAAALGIVLGAAISLVYLVLRVGNE